jgi:hypothetical protein
MAYHKHLDNEQLRTKKNLFMVKQIVQHNKSTADAKTSHMSDEQLTFDIYKLMAI